MTKEELRQKLRAERLAMDAEEAATKSRAICDRFLAEIDLSNFPKIHVYKPLPSLNEVDTGYLFSQLVEYKSRNKITEVVLGKGGKKEPIPRQKFDLIITPCLGFDKDGYRLGWGGGWYDRFLSAQPQALKVGLSYDDSLTASNLPAEPHDVQLDMIITEREIYRS